MEQQKKYYSNEEAVSVISKAAKEYKQNLLDKSILFIAKYDKKITYYRVDFKAANFLHFLGIKTKLSPEAFFQRAVSSKIKANDFTVKNKKYTTYKLDTIFDAVAIHKNAKVIGDFGNQGIKIEADMGVGNVSYTMTLRRFKKDHNYCYPVGILKSDVRNEVYPHSPILAILSKSINERFYNKCTYKSKNINLDNIHIPKELTAVITKDVLIKIKPNIQTNKENIEASAVSEKKNGTFISQKEIIENLDFDELLDPGEAFDKKIVSDKSDKQENFLSKNVRRTRTFDKIMRQRDNNISEEHYLPHKKSLPKKKNDLNR